MCASRCKTAGNLATGPTIAPRNVRKPWPPNRFGAPCDRPGKKGITALRGATLAALALLVLWSPYTTHAMQRGSAEQPVDPTRIVTLGGSITEIVYALGLGDRVVASDRTSLYPEAVRSKPRLSMLRTSSAESIIAQRPTLILATNALGPPSVRAQLRRAGIRLVVLDEVTSTDKARERLMKLANLLGEKPEGQRLSRVMETDLAQAKMLQHGTPPRVMFIYARGAGTVQVSGQNTGIDAMIDAAGGTNVFTSFEGYRPITAESVVEAGPEVILLPSRGLNSLGGIDGLLQQPGISMTPAGRTRNIVTLDDSLLLSFGPRTGKAALALTRLLYADNGTEQQ